MMGKHLHAQNIPAGFAHEGGHAEMGQSCHPFCARLMDEHATMWRFCKSYRSWQVLVGSSTYIQVQGGKHTLSQDSFATVKSVVGISSRGFSHLSGSMSPSFSLNQYCMSSWLMLSSLTAWNMSSVTESAKGSPLRMNRSVTLIFSSTFGISSSRLVTKHTVEPEHEDTRYTAVKKLRTMQCRARKDE
jgi:hypothetical protein